jgi:formylglycine-generating enzyme required for sulfatase activity
LPPLSSLRDLPEAPEMVVVPTGAFLMGSPESETGRSDGEGPRREVTIDRPFALGRAPVTFDEFDAFCDATGRQRPRDEGWGRGRRPVINVSWHDASAYLAWLSELTQAEYRLPSEAEWEYTCRAGTATAYWWGKDWDAAMANGGDGGPGQTADVEDYQTNRWGLFDTIGNVWEWCADTWTGDYSTPRGQAPVVDPAEARRVVRGGSGRDVPRNLRAACRFGVEPVNRDYDVGFRAARTL